MFTDATLLAAPPPAPEPEPEVGGFQFHLPHPHGLHLPPFRLLGPVVGAPLTAIVHPTLRTRAILALIAANVIWGTTFVATKSMLDRVPPLTVASLRFVVALLVLLPLVRLAGGRPALGRTPALLGFVGIFVVFLCQNLGLNQTSASNGALIFAVAPVFTALLALPLLGEGLDGRRVAGMVASAVGVAAVVLFGRDAGLGGSVVGDALIVFCVAAFALYLVLGRRALAHGGSLELVAGIEIYGLLFLLPVSAIEIAVGGIERPTGSDVLGLVYLGALASALAFVLWAYALHHLQAGQAAVFTNLSPLVGVAVAAVVLGETMTVVQLLGGLLILGGVWFGCRPGKAAVPVPAPLGSRA